ncbi:MAG TPA: tetratricopeptide repeat protein [Gemmatimonadales bacterium]|nr:tetratricopeptide repeat protein [Gemmatimonadales bacterium]
MPRVLHLLVLALAAAIPAQAQEPRLGTIDFPTSAAPAAQAAFVRGVLYLHSFEYASAAAAFQEAQRLEPGFALAYWGEAMTLNHPVWNEQNRAGAQAVLGRLAPTPEARQARATTDRERRFLAAVEQLYGDSGSKPRRDTLYARSMEALAAAYPHDAETQAFYALALLGLSQGNRVVPTYMRAGAISLALMQQYPDHPGAAHYTIHSFDDPDHAIIGLPAARAYSQIAPAAPHAQHMTTHIFLALGMWNEVVSQNVIAAGPNPAAWRPGHYTEWLHYGLLQLGRFADADSLYRRTLGNIGTTPSAGRTSSALMMHAAQVINAEEWSGPLIALRPASVNGSRGARAADAFAIGYAALQRGDQAAAAAEGARLRAIVAETGAPGDETQSGTVHALDIALAAASAFHDGQVETALRLIREAAASEDALAVEFGPPTVVKPTNELLGEMLLAMGRPAEAQEAFTQALAQYPQRLLSLRGLATAARAAGDVEVAVRAEGQLPPGTRQGGE